LFFWYFAIFLSLPKSENTNSFLGLIQVTNRGIILPFGVQFSPELSTLALGLTLYTGAFIAEIIRAGILSVPKGQWEAAKALGFKSGLVLRLVIFPQALRLIVPPLTSQYLNLAKNSSLAIAIGYPDIYFVASTTFNQTGRAVEVMLLIMITYLTISLVISFMMNLLNQIVQLKER
jgi:general L-amino acid transport system permease protein